MNRQVTRGDDLLVSSNFIRAVRESGYLNIASALAELIDNSLQASATDVSVTISRENAEAFPEIVVEDNGIGMSKAELENCLRFGGSTRFDSRRSFGRFGMGLPAASLSQARRVEVVAWQDGGYEHTVALDMDAIIAGTDAALVVSSGPPSVGRSGCRVRWVQCDRIEYRRLAWLERSLRRDLGRMYRRFIAAGLNLAINETSVEGIDPTLLATRIEGAEARLAFDELHYELETAEGVTSIVTVRFVTLPVERWHHLDNVTKRRAGIVGGSCVSILRSGREIANGWYLMGGKRKENYDDWWRCEIEFDPSLDEHFGITFNKQGIRPSAMLRDAIEPELESIARLLNLRVRDSFENVKFQAAAEASCRAAAAADPDLPVVASRGRGGAIQYRIESDILPLDVMFCSALADRTLKLTMNADHPAFAALYQPLQAIEGEAAAKFRASIELFLLSFARSAVQVERSGMSLDDLVHSWSDTYGRMLEKI